MKGSALLRQYAHDVYSLYDAKGRLRATRAENKAESAHRECFIRPDYLAIVIKGTVSELALQTCRATGRDMLRLTRDGRLVPMS